MVLVELLGVSVLLIYLVELLGVSVLLIHLVELLRVSVLLIHLFNNLPHIMVGRSKLRNVLWTYFLFGP